MEKFVIKTYSKSELANLYNINTKTLKIWCIQIPNFKISRNKLLKPIEVKKIIDWLGEP